jgi:hypothetical protein
MFLAEFKDAGCLGSLTIYRAKIGKPISGIVSGPAIGVPLHYYRKKSLPCVSSTETQCSLCGLGIPKRVYVYQPIRSNRGTAAIVEMTSVAANQFLSLMNDLPPKNLAILRVSRGCSRPNAPLDCGVDFKSCSDVEWDEWQRKIIDVDLIKRSLTKLWEMPDWPASMNEDDYDDLCARYVREIVAENALGYGKEA